MKLLEYEAKQLLDRYHLPIPKSHTIRQELSIPNLTFPVVVKSQVPTGGRGKAGGVITVYTAGELPETLTRLFALPINGYSPKTLLIEEKVSIKRELYLSLVIDRPRAEIILLAHKTGGINVEENNRDDFLRTPISPKTLPNVAKALGSYCDLPSPLVLPFISCLLKAFVECDALLLEINPLIVTSADTLICGDCKMEVDDTAAFRHSEWQFESSPQNANFVILNPQGVIGTMANGAGLAMATVDAVAAAHMQPANFLDIGGGASTENITSRLSQINKLPTVKAIVVNIFAGITRCDEVALAIIKARAQIPALPPLFIRLAGTNAEKATQLLAAEGITPYESLETCIDAAKELLHG